MLPDQIIADLVAARLLNSRITHWYLTLPENTSPLMRDEIQEAHDYIHENTMGLYSCNVVDLTYEGNIIYGDVIALKDLVHRVVHRNHLSMRLIRELQALEKRWQEELLV
jgi:hypothetical protein